MELEAAPYFHDVAEGPENGAAYWTRASDNLRIRVGVWPREAARGTVLLFPGRTEFIEKYARFANDMAQHSYAMMAVDWRGQGLADRLLEDARVGHIDSFADYQKDVAALVEMAHALNMPKPWYVLGHSMGGAIALRSVLEDLDVCAAGFTGPMWGILLSPVMRQLAWALYHASGWVGLSHKLPPTTDYENYIVTSEFEGNTLTNTPEMWDYMKAQVTQYPQLALGGPSIHWLGEAMKECAFLLQAPAPSLPAVCFVGGDEAIVEESAMRTRMANWASGSLHRIDNAQHEVLMEGPNIRHRVIEQLLDVFAHGRAQAGSEPAG